MSKTIRIDDEVFALVRAKRNELLDKGDRDATDAKAVAALLAEHEGDDKAAK